MRYSLTENKGLHAFVMIFALFGLMIVSLYIFSLLVKMSLPLFFGIADPAAFMNSPALLVTNPRAALYVQACTSFSIFIIPAILFYVVFRFDLIGEMGLNIMPSVKYWLLGIFTMLISAIFIQLLVQINTAIPLPDSLKHLRAPQAEFDKLMDAFFQGTSALHFLTLTFVIALLPAVGEELFFRGTIQNLISRTDLGSIGGVILTGFVFSAFHGEFNNFLAIWCMGIILGLLYYYSGSLWLSIAAHFIFNFMMILGRYLYRIGAVRSDVTGSDALQWYYTVPAAIIMVGGLVTLSKWSGKKVNSLPN